MQQILDWSEAWALLIPITVLLLNKKSRSVHKPVVLYVCIALVLNFSQNYIWQNGISFDFTSQPGDNIFIYNTHSIIRLLLFSWFFIQIKQPILSWVKKMIPVIFIVFVLINFTVFEKYTDFSSRTFSLETGLLLFLCLLYYVNILVQDQQVVYKKNPAFWITTGLSIYVVITFPIFLFYKEISAKYEYFAIHIWDLHNISYIIFCIFIAKAFHLSKYE